MKLILFLLEFKILNCLTSLPNLLKLIQIFLPQLNLRDTLVIVHDTLNLFFGFLKLDDLLVTKIPNRHRQQIVEVSDLNILYLSVVL